MRLIRQPSICQNVAMILFKHPFFLIFGLLLGIFSVCVWFTSSEDASSSNFPKSRRLFSSFGNVVEISDGSMATLNNLLKDSAFSFVLFYAPWCGQSWIAAQQFNRAAKILSGEVSFIAINCWTGTCTHQNRVDIFPKLVAFHTRFDGIEYKGTYKALKMVGFIHLVIRPFAYIGTQAELLSLKASSQELVISYFNQTSLNSRNYSTFFNLTLWYSAKASRPLFAVVTNAKLAVQAGVGHMTGVAYHCINQHALIYPWTSNYSVTALQSWIDANRCELVTQLSPNEAGSEHISRHLNKGPALILFLPIKQESKQLFGTYVQIASTYFNCSCNRTSSGANHTKTVEEETSKKGAEQPSKQRMLEQLIRNASHLIKVFDSELEALLGGEEKILSSLLEQEKTCQSLQVQREHEFQGRGLNICDVCHVCQLRSCTRHRQFELLSLLKGNIHSEAATLSNSCNTVKPSYYSQGTTSICCSVQDAVLGKSPSGDLSPVAGMATISLDSLRRLERGWDDIFEDILGTITRSFKSKEGGRGLIRLDAKRRNSKHKGFENTSQVEQQDDVKYHPTSTPSWEEIAPDGIVNNTCVRTGHVTQFLGAGCYSNRSVNFFFMDSTESWNVAENLGVRRSEKAKMALVIADLENEAQFVLDESMEITNASVVDFVMSYMAGNLSRRFRSGHPMPGECPLSHACVIEVVTSTFGDIVLDETKDVLLLYYTPWCGYCQALGPVLLAVVKYFRDFPDVTVARINADENDLPWEFHVTHFPSFILFPAYRKDFSVRFPNSLERTTANLVKFVLEHGGKTTEIIQEHCLPEGVKEKISELSAALRQVEEEKNRMEVILSEAMKNKEVWQHRRAVAMKGLKEAEKELAKQKEIRLAAELRSKTLEQKQEESEEKVLKLVAGSARVLGDLEVAEARLVQKEKQLQQLALESRRILLEKDNVLEKLKIKESALRGQRKMVSELNKSVRTLQKRVTLLQYSNNALRLKLRNSVFNDLRSNRADGDESFRNAFRDSRTAIGNTDEIGFPAGKNSEAMEDKQN